MVIGESALKRLDFMPLNLQDARSTSSEKDPQSSLIEILENREPKKKSIHVLESSFYATG